jgi:LysR family glycine cleavage system transcriptional activator
LNIYHHLKGLRYFFVTAELLSIKHASEVLSVTQAAISQQVRLLEEALGVALFIRHHRTLELTTEGAQLLPHLKIAFDAIDQGTESLLGDSDPDRITVSVSPSFASRWLIPRLGRFYEAHPEITINLSMTDKLESFSHKGSDLGIRFGRGIYAGLESRFLMKEFIYPVCHLSYFDAQQIKCIEDLQGLRLLSDPAVMLGWDYWLKKIKKHFVTQGSACPTFELEQLTQPVYFDGSHYVIDSVLSGQGVAMVRHSLAAEIVATGNLKQLFNYAAPLEQEFFVCAPRHYFRRPKVISFIKWLAREAKHFTQQYPL